MGRNSAREAQGRVTSVVRPVEGGVAIRVCVTPRSGRNEVAGVEGDTLRLRLTAPPVEGAANRACIEFLASLLGVPKGRVEITSGLRGRKKVITVYGVDEEIARRKLGL